MPANVQPTLVAVPCGPASSPTPFVAVPWAEAHPVPAPDEAKVQRLMELGFGRDDVVRVLAAANNDEDEAIALLL